MGSLRAGVCAGDRELWISLTGERGLRTIGAMDEPRARTPGPDDTAAFQRFYAGDQDPASGSHGMLYRIFVGWWRDRR
jgi:hypothetical protein